MMTEEERYLFDLHGYLVVPDALTTEHLADLNALLETHMSAEVDADARTHRFGRLLNWGESFRALVNNPRITPYLEELLGERFRLDHDYSDIIRPGIAQKGPIGTTLHGGGTPFDPSQYYQFRDGRMYNGLTVVAYNLRDVNPGDGGFACVPGSHKSNCRFPNDWRDLDAWEERPQSLVKAVTGRAGTAILFTEALTHGTLPWNGVGERRTVFLKYCPHPIAWSRGYYDPGTYEGLTEEQAAILRTPGVYPK